MGYFWADADLTGSSEFVDTATVGQRFALPACTITRLRWRWPGTNPATPPTQIHMWRVSDQSLTASVTFDATTTGEWDSATPASPIVIASADTYAVGVVTTRYRAKSGVLTSPLTRGSVTASGGYFHAGGTLAYPATVSSNGSTYYVDVDYTITGTMSAPLGALTATLGGTRQVNGTLSASLGALTATLGGTRQVNGTLSASLGALVASLTGTRTRHGIMAADMGALTAVLSGTRTVNGGLDAPLGALTATLTGTRTGHGTMSADLGALVAALGGTRRPHGARTGAATYRSGPQRATHYRGG
jgi:hypothetical protein